MGELPGVNRLTKSRHRILLVLVAGACLALAGLSLFLDANSHYLHKSADCTADPACHGIDLGPIQAEGLSGLAIGVAGTFLVAFQGLWGLQRLFYRTLATRSVNE